MSNGSTRSPSKEQQRVEHVYSYLYSECVAGTASWEWYNGAGQQNWCRVFKDLRHKEKHKVKPAAVEKGALEGKAGADRILEIHENWNLRHSCQLWIRGTQGNSARVKCTHHNDGEELLQWRVNQRFVAGLRSYANLRLGVCLATGRKAKLKHWRLKSLWKWSFRLAPYSAPVRLFSGHGINAQCSAWGGTMQWTWHKAFFKPSNDKHIAK